MALAFIWLVIRTVDTYHKKYQISREIEKLKAEVGNLEQSNQEISALIEYFGSQSFLEKETKEKLNMKKEGEEVVIIEPPKEPVTGILSDASSAILQSENQEFAQEDNMAKSGVSSEPNFIKWWKFLFK